MGLGYSDHVNDVIHATAYLVLVNYGKDDYNYIMLWLAPFFANKSLGMQSQASWAQVAVHQHSR